MESKDVTIDVMVLEAEGDPIKPLPATGMDSDDIWCDTYCVRCGVVQWVNDPLAISVLEGKRCDCLAGRYTAVVGIERGSRGYGDSEKRVELAVAVNHGGCCGDGCSSDWWLMPLPLPWFPISEVKGGVDRCMEE